MSVWLELLCNVVGYGGFVAMAIFHRAPGDKLPEHDAQ